MGPGGFMRLGKLITQEMMFPNLAHQKVYAKLQESNLELCQWEKKNYDELVEMLSGCEDFTSQQTLLQVQALAHGDHVI